jgi:hypothetical protein
MRLLSLAAVLVAVVVAVPASSTAAGGGNHQVFNDVLGDDSQGLAPDLTSVDVSSADNGDLVFKIGINEQQGTFYVGDTLAVVIDSDSNPNTGNHGADTILWVFTSTGQLDFELCNYNSDGTRTCESYPSGGATDQQTGANSHQVTFTLHTPWLHIGFYVAGEYQDPNTPSGPTYDDFAPDNGLYQFDLNDDGDADGIAGLAERCPSFAGGPLDTDKDGCPPTLPSPKFNWGPFRTSGGYITFSRVSVTNATNLTNVVVKFPGYVARRHRTGALPGIANRRFRIGSTVTFVYWNKNAFGGYRVARLTPHGFAGGAAGCVRPGTTKFMSCSARTK